MKKILLLLVLLLAVACGGPEAPVTEPTNTAESETAVSIPTNTPDTTTRETPTATVEVEISDNGNAHPVAPAPADFTPAGNPVEASEVRAFDHIIGATDPAVTIIEYGDYQ